MKGCGWREIGDVEGQILPADLEVTTLNCFLFQRKKLSLVLWFTGFLFFGGFDTVSYNVSQVVLELEILLP